MNDAKELAHAYELASRVLQSHMQNHLNDLSSPQARPYTQQERNLFRRLWQQMSVLDQGVFVASLTEQMDQLSQWRAYCPPGGGYSIGFPSLLLKTQATMQDYLLLKCIYDQATQIKLLEELIGFYLGEFQRRSPPGSSDGAADELAQNLAESFGAAMVRYGPIMKHHSFHEEREWRLITRDLSIRQEGVHHREGGTSVIPYRIFRLTSDINPTLAIEGDEDNSIVVVSGPSPDPVARAYGLNSFLFTELNVENLNLSSASPYRGF